MKHNGQLESRPRPHERRLKAVAVLPTLATLGNLVCGIGAIYMCMLSYAADGSDLLTPTLNSTRMERFFPTYVAIGGYLVALAALFDGIDGRLARLARKTSEFGAQLDSLADVVSFGLAPAMLALAVARPLTPIAALGEPERLWWRVQWVLLAGYSCCAALRLARFNVENTADESAHQRFRGLPSPGAAAALIGVVLLHEDILRVSGMSRAAEWLRASLPFAALGLGLLMVSRVRYLHMVNALLRRRRPFSHVVALVFALLVGAIIKPQLTFAVLAVGYAVSGPVLWVLQRGRGTGELAPAPLPETDPAVRPREPAR